MDRYPDDLDAATMYAESMMNLRPWQLWSLDGTPAEGTLEIVETLERVLRIRQRIDGVLNNAGTTKAQAQGDLDGALVAEPRAGRQRGAAVTGGERQRAAQHAQVFTRAGTVGLALQRRAGLHQQLVPLELARQVDADNVAETVALIKKVKPDLVINMALPYQDLPIMDACLETGVHYMDTANYEPRDVAKFEYSWQWAYQERFRERGLMALLGSGFDPERAAAAGAPR